MKSARNNFKAETDRLGCAITAKNAFVRKDATVTGLILSPIRAEPMG
jgi:hypothetical protein